MPGCCAFGCSNRTESGKTFFSIPTGKNDRERRSAWLHRIGRENFKPTKNTRVCEDHFCAEDFEKARVVG
ncbi:THAP domain-containing protein 1-like, partial [Amblyomma americanum]